MIRKPHILTSLLIMLLVAGCGGPQSATAASNAGDEATKEQVPTSGSDALDVTTVDVCALVPVAEVASELGGSPGDNPPNSHTYAGAESECWYEVAHGPGSMPEVVGVFLYPPSFFESTQEEGAIEIPGLGDEAFRSPRTDIETVIVLKRGVAVVDARAGTQDHARKVAELVLAKLEGL